MKNLLFPSFLTLVFALLCVAGCVGKHGKLMERAQASYRVNDYEAALRDAVMALKHKPDYEKAQNFAPTFFKAAVETRQNKIKSLQASASKFRWDGLVAEYKGLIEINRLVKSLPPLIHKKRSNGLLLKHQTIQRRYAKLAKTQQRHTTEKVSVLPNWGLILKHKNVLQKNSGRLQNSFSVTRMLLTAMNTPEVLA